MIQNNLNQIKATPSNHIYIIIYITLFWFLLFYSPFFILTDNIVVVLIYLVATITFLIIYGKLGKLNLTFFTLLFLICFAILYQFLFLGISIVKDIGMVISMFCTYLIVASNPKLIVFAYLKASFLVSIFGIASWFIFIPLDLVLGGLVSNALTQISINYDEIGGGRYSLFFLFNTELGSNRNFGIFWEPAVFSFVLIHALFLLEFLKLRNVKVPNVYYFVIYLAIITSQSTGGYIFLFLHLLLFNNTIKRYSLILVPVLIFISILAYTSIDFLGAKINELFQANNDQDDYHYYSGRLNFAYMLSEFSISPIFGQGRDWYYDENLAIFALYGARNLNGLAGFLIGYGAIAFTAFVYLYYKAVNRMFSGHSFIKRILIFLFFLLPHALLDLTYSPLYILLPIVVLSIESKDDAFNFSNS
tara:strand:+ start:711 stop:1964 length:1254 start_codon:yes stop_codon:yes gene_type:complete